MKRIYSLLGILLLCSGMLFAQYPANRTTKTIVADVLAQMPAQQTKQYYNQIKDLASTGEEGVLLLVKMMNPPGKGTNSQIEYALSGLSHYVSADGMEAQRLITSNAYVKALDMVFDREIKAFIIRQLELIGKDEAVAKLSTYLDNESLSGSAASALSAINTPSSQKALLNALSASTNDESAESIILAVAKLKIADAEDTLKRLLDTTNPDKRKTVLYALSKAGSKASLPDLASAAEKDNYTMRKDGGNEAYIALIKRVLSQGDTKEAEKAATGLMKKAEKAGQVQTREAALEILMKIKPADAMKLVLNALKDSNRNYRYAALTFASDYADSYMYGELIKSLKKARPEVRLDILNWLGQECDSQDKRAAIQLLINETAIGYLTTGSPETKKSAANILTKTADHKAVAALAYLLNDADPKTVEMAKNALSSTKGDISSAVAPVIAGANTVGKMAGLQLLAERKSSANTATVLEQMNSNSQDVKKAAYTALKDVVSTNDLNKLYALLETAEPENVTFVQQAIAGALQAYPKEKQYETILARMNQTAEGQEYLYYPVLASTGDVKALDIIVDRFNKEEGAAKDAAFQALSDWKDLNVADELLTICKNQSDILYFDRAINRYVQLVSDLKLSGENRRLFLTNAMEIARTDAQKNTILSRLGNTGSYLGMLLSGQYLDNRSLQQAAAGAVMNIALANKQYTGKNVEELLNKVINILDNPDAGYQKQAIRKHLNEMPKEEGFISIFNGKDLTGWKGIVENPIARAKMKPAELAKKQAVADKVAADHWKAGNGILAFDGVGGENLCTVRQYGDFEMYIDWNLDPAGLEADAGIYLRGTPQVQIWDIDRVNVGAQVGSGGLYNNGKNPKDPLKLADNKLGEWNTFYIKMVGDRVTVKLNGELVVDNVILENYWDRKQPVFPIEQIELQAHGSKVYYRNIYVKELEKTKPFELSAEEKKEGFRILFDGTNMHEWTGNTVDYQLQEGCIALDPKGSHGGNLYTKDEFGNFIYRFEFQLTPAANNGVGIRTPMGVDAAYHGMEIQILDHDNPVYKNITPLQVHGSVYGIIGAKRAVFKPMDEWNQEEIIADGNHIKVTLNGEVILDGDIKEATKNGTADGHQHPGLFNPKGHIGFLGHGSPVKFRNIRIKELK
ncbi:DUF1080 domain-containing protein [Dysgonomonas termitidis]|uniref:Family 16 glycoside hydrolase n=1 Tax=Dysgonomonas termitidis TaxID=1516126 RepID=A0ABV9KV57_9BACT